VKLASGEVETFSEAAQGKRELNDSDDKESLGADEKV